MLWAELRSPRRAARTLLVGGVTFLLVLPPAIAIRSGFWAATTAALTASVFDLISRRAATAIANAMLLTVVYTGAIPLAGWISSYGTTPTEHLLAVPLATFALMFVLRFVGGFDDAFGLKDTDRYDPKGCLSVSITVGTSLAVVGGLLAKSPLVAVGILYFVVYSAIGAILGFWPGFRCGRWLGTVARNTLTELERVGALLLDRIRPLSVFLLGYPALVFLFAGYYWIAWRADPQAFLAAGHKLQNPEFLKDFAYFSVVTIATVGYGDITPASGLARFLVCSEIFLGILLTTLVIGLIFSALQSPKPPDARQ